MIENTTHTAPAFCALEWIGTATEHLAAAHAAEADGQRYWGRVSVPVPARDGTTVGMVVVGVYTGTLTDHHGPITRITECECPRCAELEPWDRAAPVHLATPTGLVGLQEVGWEHITADRNA